VPGPREAGTLASELALHLTFTLRTRRPDVNEVTTRVWVGFPPVSERRLSQGACIQRRRNTVETDFDRVLAR